MCGFAGIFQLSPFAAPEDLADRAAAMAAAIAHRGPDAQNVHTTPFAAVAFRRLAIVDLVTGDQPVKNADGSIAVFFNGEIYNHLELREKLRVEHGIHVARGSDAAVLPHLYQCYGPDFVELCNGMFAICVLDSRDGTCRIYRDRLGIKPMYFAVTPNAVVFGSELKALFASGLVRASIDPAQVVPFLELFYVPGQATLCRGVEKLLPGERLLLAGGKPPRRERWWRLAARLGSRRDDAIDELDGLLADATRLQLMADVPIGISLSGGLDSSLIAYYAHEGDAKIRAYTIAFPGTDPGELACARQVSQSLGIEQVEITAPEGNFLGELDRTTFFNDEPIADPAFYPALLVARAAAQHVKVLLAGSGADELFAGYGHYRLTSRATAYRLLAHVIGDGLARRAVGMRRTDEERAALRAFPDRMPWHTVAMTHLTPADRHALQPLVHRDHLEEIAAGFREAACLDPINRQLIVDTQTYLPHQLLSLLDRTTMGASIEGRVPFLDHRVAELAMAVHGRHKLGVGTEDSKVMLRTLAARHLPAQVATRKKHGFPNSVPQWLAADQLPRVREHLLDRGGFATDFFPTDWLQSKVASTQALHENALTVHSLLVLESWHRVFARRSTPSAGPRAAAART